MSRATDGENPGSWRRPASSRVADDDKGWEQAPLVGPTARACSGARTPCTRRSSATASSWLFTSSFVWMDRIWARTVVSETQSCSAIVAARSPRARRSSTSRSRAVNRRQRARSFRSVARPCLSTASQRARSSGGSTDRPDEARQNVEQLLQGGRLGYVPDGARGDRGRDPPLVGRRADHEHGPAAGPQTCDQLQFVDRLAADPDPELQVQEDEPRPPFLGGPQDVPGRGDRTLLRVDIAAGEGQNQRGSHEVVVDDEYGLFLHLPGYPPAPFTLASSLTGPRGPRRWRATSQSVPHPAAPARRPG